MLSPCKKICKIETVADVKYCIGCNRSLDQIRDWSKLTDDERREIMLEILDETNNDS